MVYRGVFEYECEYEYRCAEYESRCAEYESRFAESPCALCAFCALCGYSVSG